MPIQSDPQADPRSDSQSDPGHYTGPDPDAIDEAAAKLRAASRVLFITGAGMSADSGLPTYRGIGGLYDDRATDEGMPIEVALSITTLRRAPGVCWKYIHQIERSCRGAAPNRGHQVLAEIERDAGLDSCVILTQNVDGLHRAAGSREVIEIHGNIHRLRCTACAWRDQVDDYAHLEIPPACPSCRALVRPEVILFGEMLPAEAVERLQAELARGFDVVVSVGTTSVFPYIAAPIGLTRARGGYTLEINPGETEVSREVDRKIYAGGAQCLDALWRAWRVGAPRRG